MCVAIGTFDGVHVGHQAVIRRTVTRARSDGSLAMVATFDRHPATVLAPRQAPLLIQSLPQRLRCLAALGVDATWLIQFDRNLSEKTGEDFVRSMMRSFPALRAVLVGDKFRFGHRRGGTVALLHCLGGELGFDVEALPPVSINGAPVSSTRVRQEIRAGRLAEVQSLLGRPYALAGMVVQGDGLGRQIGFPTANLDVTGQALPPNGVYAAHATLQSWSGPAVVNLGTRPTLGLGNAAFRIEAHMIGFEGNVYGQEIEVQFLAFLRPEKRFATIDALREQIAVDCNTARERHSALHVSDFGRAAGPVAGIPAGARNAPDR